MVSRKHLGSKTNINHPQPIVIKGETKMGTKGRKNVKKPKKSKLEKQAAKKKK
jgi:hypothetical protein